MTSKFKRVTAVALVSLTALGGAVVSAEAGGNKHFNSLYFSNNSFHQDKHRLRVFTYSPYSCEYYYDKWQWTGSRFWKKQYYSCIYGW